MKKTEVEEAIEVLKKIALSGDASKGKNCDWENIGRWAVNQARQALAGKCPTCQRAYEFKGVK